MRILVIGTVIFTEKMLEKLISHQANLIGVVTSKDNQVNADYVDLEAICSSLGIPFYKTNDINDTKATTWIRNQEPDVIFCLGWSQIIKPLLLNLPPKGIIGFHPSALPKNRGRHPVIWALVLGLSETASTFFYMNESADCGAIVSQKNIAINDRDDAQSLYSKIVYAAGLQLVNLVDALHNETICGIPQNEFEANVWRKRGEADGIIDWRMSNMSIHNLVRGLTKPYVGAEFYHLGASHKVWRTRLVKIDNIENAEPGKVISTAESSFIVRCGEGCIELCDIEPHIQLNKGDYL